MESLLDHSLSHWVILVFAAFLMGFSKTGLPGAGILAIPLVAFVVPAKASTGVVLPMLIMGDIFAVAFYRRHADWRHLWLLMPWALVGIVLGFFVLGWITDDQLRPIIGAVILVMLGLNQLRTMRKMKVDDDSEVPHSRSFAATMGLVGGAVTMMANAAGPVIALYMLAMRLPKNIFVGTGAWYFMIMNCVKVPFSAKLGLINKESLLLNLYLLPALVVGALIGVSVLKILPEKLFNRLVLVLAALAALKLLLS